MNESAQRYVAQGRVFLAQALEEFEQDDVRQASEKAWGAAAQFAKAAAEEHGWPHRSHGSLFAAIRQLVQATGDESLRSGFNTAGELHTNYYEGHLSSEYVLDCIGDVTRFVDEVEVILNNGRNGASS